MTEGLEDRMVQGIVGGVSISDRVIGNNVIIEDIWDTYVRYAGAKAAVDLKPMAAFHNGFTEELDAERKYELIKNDIWTQLFGYSIVVYKDGDIQAINPRVNRVGFIFTKFEVDTGEPMEIGIRWNPDEQFHGPDIMVKRAPFSVNGEGDLNGFYPFRSLLGLPGSRGLSVLISLIDIIRAQNQIYKEYTKYAEHQGLAHPVVKIENLTDTARDQVRGQLTAPRKDKAVIIDMKDDFYYESPQQSAYDPSYMMEFGDKYIVRESAINMSMLTGDPTGYLSSSNVQVNEWFTAVKAYQDHKLPQYLPLLIALGLSEEVKFQDPSEPTLEGKLESVKMLREGLEGLVAKESLLRYINNEILGLEGEEELELISDEEYDKYSGNNDNNGENENDSKQEPDSSES